MRINFHVIRLLLAIATVISTVPLFASDGQLEINQACAVNTGCFTGDTPGFPVTITTPGSYRLTGSLNLSAEGVNVSGIEVSAPAVTVDLGGFHIAGATTCSGSGASISCSPPSTGGSAGVHFMSNATASVVQNGIVRNMTNFGIRSQATGLRVKDITAIHNGADGINGTSLTFVVNSVSIENGQDGIVINLGSEVDGAIASNNGRHGILDRNGSVLTRSNAQGNAGRGFYGLASSKFGKNNLSRRNGEADSCGGGICTDRRRIYLTQGNHAGNAVLTACALGFHPASINDVQDAGQFQYDTTLGRTGNTVHLGPPYHSGWVTHDLDNSDNCNGFTNGLATTSGVIAEVQAVPLAIFSGGVHPPEAPSIKLSNCDDTRWGVWCVED